MHIIVITPPDFRSDEADVIVRLLRHGVWAVHLRKPQSSVEAVQALIESIPQEWHCRLVLHDHFELAGRYALKGVHFNGRNPVAPPHHRGSLSCSTHSIAELRERLPAVDYAFLSPIFDSISKQDYPSAFSPADLQESRRQGLIGERTFALGGVTLDRLPVVSDYGFGGAALLGDVWQKVGTPAFPPYLETLQRVAAAG